MFGSHGSTHGKPSDTTLRCSDGARFYVHYSRLSDISENDFDGLLAPPSPQMNPPLIDLTEDGETINLILYIVYEAYFHPSRPTCETLRSTLQAVRKYRISPSRIIPKTPLFDGLVAQFSEDPLELYALGAENDIFELASHASEQLQGVPMNEITDEMANRIGPVYLIRLHSLRECRADVLRHLLAPLPRSHEPDSQCGSIEAERMKMMWSNTALMLIANVEPSEFKNS